MSAVASGEVAGGALNSYAFTRFRVDVLVLAFKGGSLFKF